MQQLFLYYKFSRSLVLSGQACQTGHHDYITTGSSTNNTNYSEQSFSTTVIECAEHFHFHVECLWKSASKIGDAAWNFKFITKPLVPVSTMLFFSVTMSKHILHCVWEKSNPYIHCRNSGKQCLILTEFWTNNAMSNCKQITKFKYHLSTLAIVIAGLVSHPKQKCPL